MAALQVRPLRFADLFAGMGGFTQGGVEAGLEPVYAANHARHAVAAHSYNHPSAEHVCQDVRQADWSELPFHDLLLASPSCRGNSNAGQAARKRSKKVRKKHDELRATAMAVIDCVEECMPSAVVVENVVNFRKWKLYPVWKMGLEVLGYQIQEHVLRASRYGVPQRRDRLFVVATHERSVELDLKPDAVEPAFGPCIEWDAPANWESVASKSVAVRDRVAKGRRNHGARFLTQHVSNHPGVPLDEPIRTVTCQDHWAIVDGEWMRQLTIRENARAMGFPDDYYWPEECTRGQTIEAIGNAVCPPVAARLLAELSSHIQPKEMIAA